jgi:hypothetical protein
MAGTGINLGNAVHMAVRDLRDSPDFRRLVEALGERTWEHIRNSLESSPDQRVNQTAYAKCMLDMWVAISAELDGTTQLQNRRTPTTTEKMRSV